MATVLTDNKHYQDIANAIRAKGVNGIFKPSEMADAILSIETVVPVYTYVPIFPDDITTYPLSRNVGGIMSFAAQRSDDALGYYSPLDDSFVTEVGMTGTIIERCEYVSFSGSEYVNSDIELTGADTVIIDFVNEKSGDNIFGSWKSDNKNVYSLYASSASSYVRYGSSLYRNTPISLSIRHTFKMTPTGDYVDGTQYHTWTAEDFSTGKPCIIGWLDGSSSPKMEGSVSGFEIIGKSELIPVKIGSAFYLFDKLRWTIPTHVGTFGGGMVTGNRIPFPGEENGSSSLLSNEDIISRIESIL